MVFRDNKYIISAGEDGLIKFWDFEELDNAESDDFFNFYLTPSREEYIKHDENVKPRKLLIFLKFKKIKDPGSYYLDHYLDEKRILDFMRCQRKNLQGESRRFFFRNDLSN